MIGALSAGLVAGAAHALLGPDHLAAVAPLSLRHGKAAARIGVRWGLGHGLAGFGHLWAALPALAMPRDAAIAYLAGYGSGTVLAMAAFTSLLGFLATRAGAVRTRALRVLAGASGVAAVAVGVWWLWRGGAWG